VVTGPERDTPAVDTPSQGLPETRYAKSGEISIAYQVVGDGPFDIVWVPGSLSNVELVWEIPLAAAFFRRLAAFSRLILFDKRGTGLSDRTSGIANLETRMDDVRAVMDAAGSSRAAVLGASEGGPMSVLFAATYPERTAALVLYGAMPRFVRSPDFPWGASQEEFEREHEEDVRAWGTIEGTQWIRHPGTFADPEKEDAEVRRWATYMRQSGSPGDAAALAQMVAEIDVRPVLPTIRVPTLVVHRTEDHLEIGAARWMAGQIPGARFIELPGGPHLPFHGDSDSLLDAIEGFVVGLFRQGAWAAAETDRVLATVLFTDIVGSTARAAALGDSRWRELLEEHHRLVRSQLTRFRGREVDTAGDGFFASFDGPARAIRCACEIRDAVRPLGIEIRAGLHTGECELIQGKIGGIAVHVGARVAAEAKPGEVLVSGTVKDLVAGSGLEFEDHGSAGLKGVPGEWRLFAVREG
jgi:class 3 adenylate cyclase